MMRAVRAAAVLIGALAMPAAARAQGGVNGSIVGNVFDQTGLPLKGIKIVARSETQIGGPKSVYSNDEGAFRFPGLQPGVFEVQASAPKLKSVVQKDIQVGINAPAEITLIMEVETQVEEVRVVERAPIVSTTSAKVREIYDEEFIDKLPVPHRATIQSVIGNTVPGAIAPDNTVNSVRIRGGTTGQNEFTVDGFKMNDQRITHGSLAAFEVSTAGYGADGAAAPGGVVSMVTKSGSNKLELDVNGFAEDSYLRFFIDPSEVGNHEWEYFINPSVSGPIVKDRLWYYFNGEYNHRGEKRPDESGLFPDSPDWIRNNFRGSFKLTWQVSPRNKLVSFSHGNADYVYNDGGQGSTERDAMPMVKYANGFTGLIWESLLTDNLLFRSQVGVSQFWRLRAPMRCNEDPDACLHEPRVVQTFPRTLYLNNHNIYEQQNRYRTQVVNQLEWFVDSKALGHHSVKVKNDYLVESIETVGATTGDQVITIVGNLPDRRQEFFSNDPRFETARYGFRISGSTAHKNILSLTDAMRIGRTLTVTPGATLVWARASNNFGHEAMDQTGVAPSVSAAWDATHDGRTVARASFSNYMDVDVYALGQHSIGSQVSRTCRWNEATGDFDLSCAYSGGTVGRTYGRPCGPDGIDVDGSSCEQALEIPRTWEYTVGAERELVPGLALGTDVIYRLYQNQRTTVETNRIWNASGTLLDPQSSYRNGRAETISDMETPDSARRRYLALAAGLRKREGRLRLSGGYTWSRLEGSTYDGFNGSAWGTVPGRDVYLHGFLSDDHRHEVKAQMVYQLTGWLSAGVNYAYLSGRPYSRRFRNLETGGRDDYRARIGVNPGGNINDPGDDRELRTPDIMSLALQIRGDLRPLIGQKLEVYADVINLLALRTPTSLIQDDGPTFGQTAGRMAPFRMRVGMRYRF